MNRGRRPQARALSRRAAAAVIVGVTTGLACTVSLPAANANPDQIVTIDGRGFGHGVGMAQDGAYWMGRSGRSANQIIQTFYPGTAIANRGGAIRVPLATAGAITLSFPGGGRVGKYNVGAGGSATIRVKGGGLQVDIGGKGQAAGTTRSAGVSGIRNLVAFARPFARPIALVAPFRSPAPVKAVTAPVPVVGAPAPPSPTPVQAGAPIAVEPASSTTTSPPPNPAENQPAQPVPVQAVPVQPVPVQSVPATPEVAAVPVPVVPSDVASNPEPGEAPTQNQSAGGLLDDAPAPPTEPVSARIEATGNAPIGLGGRRYRGSIELQARGGSVRAVNIVDVEQYLRGMGEILYRNWPAATLQTQAIAARTYALRMMGSVGEVCPTQACQVYLGAQVEYPQMDAAVRATAKKVITYKGKLAATFYSASGGGTIATPEEGFGKGAKDVPYLRAGVYVAGDVQSWTVSMRLGEIARRVGYRGTPSSIAITQVGPSGRATEITVYGSGGAMRVGGPRFDAALGLKSTLFTFRGSGVGIGTSAVVVPVTTPLAANGSPLSGLSGISGVDGVGADAQLPVGGAGSVTTLATGGGTFPTVPRGGTFPTAPPSSVNQGGGGTFPTAPQGTPPVTEPAPAVAAAEVPSTIDTLSTTLAASVSLTSTSSPSTSAPSTSSPLTTAPAATIETTGTGAPAQGRSTDETPLAADPPITEAASATPGQIEITTEPESSSDKALLGFAGAATALLGIGVFRRFRQRT